MSERNNDAYCTICELVVIIENGDIEVLCCMRGRYHPYIFVFGMALEELSRELKIDWLR